MGRPIEIEPIMPVHVDHVSVRDRGDNTCELMLGFCDAHGRVRLIGRYIVMRARLPCFVGEPTSLLEH